MHNFLNPGIITTSVQEEEETQPEHVAEGELVGAVSIDSLC